MIYPKLEPEVKNQCVVDRWVEINGTPAEIWPWLAQMGNGRAGWYSYDWLDNLGKKSFEFIDPELVKIEKNQKISFALVSEVEVETCLTYDFGSWASMTLYLENLGNRKTRLWSRVRFKDPGFLFKILLKQGHIFMQNKQFKEIKRRVENRL